MKIMTGLLIALALTGCFNGQGGSNVPKTPGVGVAAHGYETEDGKVVTYRKVDTGSSDAASPGSGGYSDRAVAE